MCWLHLMITIFASSAFAQPDSYRGYTLLSVNLQNQEHVTLMKTLEQVYENQLDFFTHPSTKQPTDILIPPQLINEIHDVLNTNGIPYTDRVSDYQEVIDEERKTLVTHDQIVRRRQRVGQYTKTNYLDFESIMEFLYEQAATYPDLMSIETLGLTYEERDLNMVKLSRNDGKTRPVIIMESLTHAREWITGAVMINIIQAMTEDADDMANDMLDWFDCRGFGAKTGCSLIDALVWTLTEIGDMSTEIETKLFSETMEELKRTRSLMGFISLHSYSQVLLVPMGYSEKNPTDYGFSDALLRDVASNATEAFSSVYGTWFKFGTPLERIGYGASGGAYDYALAELRIPFSYTYELRDRGELGFVLPPSEILPSFLETYPSIYSIAKDIHKLTTGM